KPTASSRTMLRRAGTTMEIITMALTTTVNTDQDGVVSWVVGSAKGGSEELALVGDSGALSMTLMIPTRALSTRPANASYARRSLAKGSRSTALSRSSTQRVWYNRRSMQRRPTP